MIAKAGLGLVGLGAIGVGGAALAKPSWFGIGGEDHMPECHYLSEDKGFSTDSDYGADTFGKKYGRYLVGVTNKDAVGSKPEHSNKDWWDWAYRRLDKKETRPKKFESVTQGYDINSNSKALNQVCKEAYKIKDKNEFGTNSSNDKFTKSDVWKYCSLGTLVDISNDGYTNEQVGGQTENKTLFVSVKSSDNDWFWKIRNEDFWSANSGEWSGSKASGSKTDSSFKNEYETGTSEGGTKETIKNICKSVYEASNSSSGGRNKNKDDAKKFCALELPSS